MNIPSMHASRNNETGEGEKPETSKHSKGKSSMQRRRVICRRLLRDKINRKLKTLQELIPNCSKRGQASILDDAVKYINNLQTQLQMMSMTAIWPTYGWAMNPQQLQLGMQVSSLAPFLQDIGGIKYELGARMRSDVYFSSHFPEGHSSFLPPQPPLSYNQILQQSLAMGGGSITRVMPTQIVPSPCDHAVIQDSRNSESSECVWMQV
ncbi:transcription factor PIF5-like isoform X2 [Salvia hispanica]|uniref:transcription factor PIF5-like isoform X2 n=1 Tax=Salvia hispanica TaxID=49212 RepID=UPI0020095744|nr:transcription factor PIF5-like isoform X2 [Salvia hispanica]